MIQQKNGLDALNRRTDTLTIAFIGGSITEGTNRATPGHYYVDLVGSFFCREFGTQKVNIINAGWGGTGSEFGLFRLYEDVSRHAPDLVFVEFAANDILKAPSETKLYMENIVQNLIALPKMPVINFIYTTDNEYKAAVAEHEEVARHYGIPSINILCHIKSLVSRGEVRFDEIFGDQIHPNDYGYRIYADYIIKTIFENREKYFVLPHSSAERLNPRRLDNPSIVPVTTDMLSGGWTVRERVNRHLPPAFASSGAGSRLYFEFDGDYLGILCEDMYLDGEAVCTIDQTPLGNVGPKAYSPALICRDLTKGHHTFTLETISDTPFCIAAFTVNKTNAASLL